MCHVHFDESLEVKSRGINNSKLEALNNKVASSVIHCGRKHRRGKKMNIQIQLLILRSPWQILIACLLSSTVPQTSHIKLD